MAADVHTGAERMIRRRFWIALVATFGTVFYLSFRASGAGGLELGFLHYFKVWFPIWGIVGAYGIARLLDRLETGASRSVASKVFPAR